ncbi:unnamed protein product, partial [Owenia fusiformis]
TMDYHDNHKNSKVDSLTFKLATNHRNKTTNELKSIDLKPMDVVIVTAASNEFFRGLTEFVASVHFWEPRTKIVVYDIGLTLLQKQDVHTWCNVESLNLPKTTPPRILLGSRNGFAWKPIILQDAVRRYGAIFYSDAGSVIRGPLGPIKRLILKDGYFFVQGQDTDMTMKTHKGMFSYFNVTKSRFINKYSFAGGIQGYVNNSTAVKHILTPLVHCALKRSCISPRGSHVLNHRYDQSALSIIIYMSSLNIQPHTEFLAADRSQLNKDPLEESKRLIWTARQFSSDYRLKTLCIKN